MNLKNAPARVAALLATVASIALALVPVLANLDVTSTAGIIAGIVSILGVATKWLDGQQKHEARQAQIQNPQVKISA